MFTKVLIANRGEIACRVIRTARRLGIRTVTVYSDADAHARHVRLADEAVRIGPAAAQDSYLAIDHLIDAAVAARAQAVHPGYGFLSENADFVEACERAGLAFIGPPASAIRAMGSKSAAKALLEKAAVPLTPGYHGKDQDAAFLKKQAGRIGYPVLIKASAGGGGKGMRIVHKAAEFESALASCQREAASSFGDDTVLLEKYIARSRHIEIQIFADRHGNYVHLFERDCSVQRRHQKIVEEAPAPGIAAAQRDAMGKAAISAARAVGYVGAGTVEFIVEPSGAFYFMEMNTRLQVEHPVTEMVTGLDLVEWQLRIAAGERLPRAQDQLSLRGHAIEVRIYAEDPGRDFLPSPGRLLHLAAPTESRHVRVDTGVEQGDEITPHYDPMIAKLVAWDETRDQARAHMLHALSSYRIVGVATNIELLRRLMNCPAFAAADLATDLIDRERAVLFAPPEPPPAHVYLLAAVAELLREQESAATRAAAGVDPFSPWQACDGWRLNTISARQLVFKLGESETTVTARREGGAHDLRVGDAGGTAIGWLGTNGVVRAELNGMPVEGAVIPVEHTRHVFLHGRAYPLVFVDPLHHDYELEVQESGLCAPMSGKIAAVLVTVGAVVERGAVLLVLEAMKMEHAIVAPAAGVVRVINARVGDQVTEGAALVEIEPTTQA